MICPFCKEEISPNSFQCQHCGGLVTENSNSRHPRVLSGLKGKSTLPAEIKKWNWGAFLLTWIWGLFNGVYIEALLILILPFVVVLCFVFGAGPNEELSGIYIAVQFLAALFDLVWWFVLGAKGNEWAWKNKRWASLAHFKRVQRIWSRVAVGLLLGIFLLGIFSAIFIPQLVAYKLRGHQATPHYLNALRNTPRNPVANQGSLAPRGPVILDDAIRMVQNGYFENYKQKTIGEAVDKYFTNPQWELHLGVEEGIKGALLVTANGRVPGKEGEAKLQFVVDPRNQKFYFHSFELDGMPQDKTMTAALLNKMYE